MVKRTVLSPTPKRLVEERLGTLADAIKGHNTTPTGNKDLGVNGNIIWTRPDGSSITVRHVDEELVDARERIDDATADLADTQERLDGAEQVITTVGSELDNLANATIPSIVADLEAADQAAAQELAELDNRLGDFATDESLGPIREALADAQDAVDAAKSIAETANQAANAASQAALEAAGIAASKGRVIIQETEPVGEDRNAANIWIKPIPDDPTTEIEEKAITYVYLEGSNEWVPTSSDELAQAAQNALDAREAAQQATQRAETAISNAATAQSAAEAAQRTADQATTDAREAHNEAVAAQAAADAAIARGDNLILNGSFELDAPAWPRVAGRYGVSEHEGARTGSRVMRLSPVNANAYPMSNLIAVQEGQQIYVQMWYRYLPDDRQSRLCIYYRQYDGAGVQTESGYGNDEDGRNKFVHPGDLVENEWALFTATIPIAAGTTHLEVSPHALSASTDIFHIDDFQAVDVTEARKAQARADEAYAEAAKKLDESQVDAKITASANGKNSITRAVTDPTTDGVVAGDLWVRVDAEQNAFAQWYWNNAEWIPTQIRNEMMESLDVHKLQVTGDAVINGAVIDRLWVDGIVGKSAVFNQINVAAGNLFIDPNGLNPELRSMVGGPEWSWDDDGKYWKQGYQSSGTPQFETYSRTGSVYDSNLLTPGAMYLIAWDAWIDKVGPSTRARASIYYRKTDGSTAFVGDGLEEGGDSEQYDPIPVGGQWVRIERYWRAPDDVVSGGINLQFNSPPDDYTECRVRNPFVGKQSSAVLIEDGAITTPKLTVTEDMSAAIVNAMSVNAKKLVVSEEAILNHATLIGQTVVDDINVQGKLIGTDGVFTGTVDFANVNVTGDVLASKISGEHVYGTIVEGGEIRTTAESGGQVILSDNGFVSSYSGAVAPGLMLIPADTSQMANPPGIGPFEGGVAVDGGRNADGGYSFLRTKPEGTLLYARDANNSRGEIQTLPGISLMTSSQGSSESRLQARPTEMFIRNTAGDGTQGETLVRSDRATLTTRDPAGATMSTLGAQGRGAWMRAYAVNGDTASGNMSQNQANLWVRTATGATKSILCADNRAAYMRANATDGAHGIASATPALVHLSTYGSDGATRSTLRADGRTVWMRANATNGDSGFVQASPAYSLIKSESGTGNREVATNTEKAYLKATATSGNYSLVESAFDGARMTRVADSTNVRTCAVEVYGGQARMYGTSGSGGQDLRGQVLANGDGVEIYSGYGGTYIRLRRDGAGDQFACDAIYRRTSSAAANVSVTPYGTVRRMTSSRRYKRNIANWSPDPKAVLALQPRQWQDRQDVTEIDETWHVGFIAEEVDDLGLKKLVQYVGDGKGGWIPESLNYDRFAAAQQVVLQKHEAEIKELRERIALLESK